MKRIKTVLAGLGRIGWQYHLPMLQAHPGFELIALVDPLKSRLEEAAAECPNSNLYESFEQMLVCEKPELVVVASPTIFHADQIIRAFGHGADVFAEKPLAMNLHEADKIIHEMRRFKRKLMVYQPRRLDLDCLQAKEIIDSGILGPLQMIKRNIRNYSRRDDWQAMRCYGGGMLNNYGVHYIDQLFHVIDFDFNCEYCDLRRIASLGDADDFFKIILRNPENILAEVEVSQTCAFVVNDWVIEGEYGAAYLSLLEPQWKIRFINSGELQPVKLQRTLAADDRRYPYEKISWQEDFQPSEDKPAVDFYDNLYDYLLFDKPPFVKINETRKVMEIIDQARNLNPMDGKTKTPDTGKEYRNTKETPVLSTVFS
jgi:predicted dehydrogenase